MRWATDELMFGVYRAHHGFESIASGATLPNAWHFFIVSVGQADSPLVFWDNKCRVLSLAKIRSEQRQLFKLATDRYQLRACVLPQRAPLRAVVNSFLNVAGRYC